MAYASPAVAAIGLAACPPPQRRKLAVLAMLLCSGFLSSLYSRSVYARLKPVARVETDRSCDVHCTCYMYILYIRCWERVVSFCGLFKPGGAACAFARAHVECRVPAGCGFALPRAGEHIYAKIRISDGRYLKSN